LLITLFPSNDSRALFEPWLSAHVQIKNIKSNHHSRSWKLITSLEISLGIKIKDHVISLSPTKHKMSKPPNPQAQPITIPKDGKILLPTLIDAIAESHPQKLHAEYPINPQSYSSGYRRITYADLANAVNGVAWWLHRTLGPNSGDGEGYGLGGFEKLAYIGPNDLRYPVLVLGAVKAGFVMFLPSPRNSITAQVELIKKLDCKIMLSPTPQLAPTTAILSAIELQVLEVPSVEELLDTKYPHFPYNKSYESAFLEPIFAVIDWISEARCLYA